MPILNLKYRPHGRTLWALSWVVLALLFGCALTPWTPTSGPISAPHYTIDIPQDWLRLEGQPHLMLTKDGPFLQYVLIQARPLTRPFRYTGRKVAAHMLPSDAAQVILDEIGLDPTVNALEVLENHPALIDGREGFKLMYAYQNSDGLTLRTVYYGCIHQKHLFTLRYTAAQRYYFQKDRTDFNQMRASFKLQ
jgi:hypothetical protein